MKKTKNTSLNINVNTACQTPIEIALQIDENGMTTLSALYSFLELDKSHYKRWYNKNIINNHFATENIDYVIIRPDGENPINGRPKLDFKLTSDFAKQLSMTVKNERGQEARQYFIACEQGLKIANEKIHKINLEEKFLTTIENMTLAVTELTNRITTLEENVKSQSQQPPHKQIYNPWFSKMNNKYQLLQDYFNITRGQLYRNILLELEDLYDLNTTQIQADYLYENNLTSCYPLDPYSFVPKYRDMIEQIVNTNLVKYKIASEDDPITSTRHITIFDTPVDSITH